MIGSVLSAVVVLLLAAEERSARRRRRRRRRRTLQKPMGHCTVAEALVAADADLNTIKNNGCTSLKHAQINGSTKVENLLR
jgi:hypothetical protein